MWTGVGRAGRSDSSCSDEDFGGRDPTPGADQYEPIKRLALLRLQPPRNPNKPPTPFLIRDILNGRVGKRRRQCGPVGAAPRDVIVRPWLETPMSPCGRGGSAGSVSDDIDDDYDEDDEEIEVEEKKPPANQSVSPLDALLQMATKTFDGLKSHETQPNDSARTDQLNMFAKTAPSKKRRKSRTAFTNQQIYELEKRFLYQKYLTPTDRDEIALSLGLTNAQVITWFQNRRAKLKRDLEELKADVTAAKKTSECGSEMDEEMPYVPVSSSPDEMRSREAAELDALKALSPKTPVTSSIRLDTTATSANS